MYELIVIGVSAAGMHLACDTCLEIDKDAGQNPDEAKVEVMPRETVGVDKHFSLGE